MADAPRAADLIADLVAGGHTVASATSMLATWIPSHVLVKAREEYEATLVQPST